MHVFCSGALTVLEASSRTRQHNPGAVVLQPMPELNSMFWRQQIEGMANESRDQSPKEDFESQMRSASAAFSGMLSMRQPISYSLRLFSFFSASHNARRSSCRCASSTNTCAIHSACTQLRLPSRPSYANCPTGIEHLVHRGTSLVSLSRWPHSCDFKWWNIGALQAFGNIKEGIRNRKIWWIIQASSPSESTSVRGCSISFTSDAFGSQRVYTGSKYDM